MSDLGFVLEYSFRKEFLFNVENACRLFSMVWARKRGSMIVEAIDAEKSIKHASPEMLIKHALEAPEEYRLCRKIREENFRVLKRYMESLDKPRLLDAGCGWGRQITSYHRRGLTAEFFGVDINKIAVH